MQSIRHKTLFAAVFVFAAGFASTADAHRDCAECMVIYDMCMARPGTDQWICAREHNECAQPMFCPVMPE